MPRIGPIGQYPFGSPISATDRGALWAGFKVDKETRLCALLFGTQLSYIDLTVDEITKQNRLIRLKIRQTWGELGYNKAELPIKVELITNNRVARQFIIRIHMPLPAEGLVANPEAFLALADVIEDRIAAREKNVRPS